MPSSTSNSEPEDAAARVPEGLKPARLLQCIILGILLVLAAECFWRSRGMTPTVPDTAALWGHEYKAALLDSERSMVILGSSRALLGLDLETIQTSQLKPNLHQLGTYGSSPLILLRHLAEETDYAGLVLAELNPILFLDSEGRADALPKSYLAALDQGPLYEGLEVEARSFLHGLLASRRPAASPLNILKELRHHQRWPQAEHIRILGSRQALADFSIADVDQMIAFRLSHFRQTYKKRPRAGEAQLIADLLRYAETIAARGGQVIYLKMPTDGATEALEEELAPDQIYWEPLANRMPKAVIRSEQEPALAAFHPDDESHLGQETAPGYTRALIEVILSRGLLPESWSRK